MGLDSFIYGLGRIKMQGSYGEDRIYDDLNEFLERNSIFHDLTMAFFGLTFTAMFGMYVVASLLFVWHWMSANHSLTRRRSRTLLRRTKNAYDSAYNFAREFLVNRLPEGISKIICKSKSVVIDCKLGFVRFSKKPFESF